MRWESKVKYAELAPAQTWSIRDEGNFGGFSLLTPDSNTLSHHGVPGMHWGITTKEYVKKGYNTIARRRAILKQKRKAEAKAQFEEGYKRGQRVASDTYFIKRKVGAVLARKEAKNKQSLSDRAIDKGTDFVLKKSGLDKMAKEYGVDAFLPKAKDFLKEQKDKGLDKIYDTLKDEEGQKKIQEAVNYVLTGRVTKGIVKAASAVASSTRRNAPKVRKAIGRGVKASGKAALSGAKAGYRYLRTGNPTGAQRIHNKIRTAEQIISKAGNATASAISKGAKATHRGARDAQRQLDNLLAKRRRRA